MGGSVSTRFFPEGSLDGLIAAGPGSRSEELVRAASTTTVVNGDRPTQNVDHPPRGPFADLPPGRAGAHRAPTNVGPAAQLLSEVLVVLLRVAMSVIIASSAAASGSVSRWI